MNAVALVYECEVKFGADGLEDFDPRSLLRYLKDLQGDEDL